MLVVRYLSALMLSVFYHLFEFIFGPLTLFLTYGLSQLFFGATLSENVITISKQSFVFVPACIAALAYGLLALLILTTKGISFKNGLLLFVLGSLLILGANLLRIELLFYLFLTYGIDYFKTLHLFIWHVVSSVYVVFVWLFITWRFKVKHIPLYSDFVFVRKKI